MTDIIEQPTSAVYRTRRLPFRAKPLPPTQVLRLAPADPARHGWTGEIPLLFPTGAELAVGPYSPDNPTPPPRPLPPPPPLPPSWAARVGAFPTVVPRERRRPLIYVGRRRALEPLGLRLLVLVGSGLVGGAFGGAGLVALAVTW